MESTQTNIQRNVRSANTLVIVTPSHIARAEQLAVWSRPPRWRGKGATMCQARQSAVTPPPVRPHQSQLVTGSRQHYTLHTIHNVGWRNLSQSLRTLQVWY